MARTQDILTMARTVYGEAEPFDTVDAKAIAHVILNRVKLPNWPNSIEAVCLQPYQFSCWNADNPRRKVLLELDLADTEAWWLEIVDICRGVLDGRIPDPTNRSTHYYATYIKKPKWARGHQPVFSSGWGKYTHDFFNDIDTPPPVTAAEALEQQRPVASTTTAKGVQASSVGVAGMAVAEVVQEAAQNIEPLVPYLDAMKWVFIGLTIVGIVVVAWARLRDRKEGKR